MRTLAVASLLLTSCNAWVRPTPPPPLRRTPAEQREAAVRIESRCDPFGDGQLTKLRVGSGVMVSDWQVLTAIHVVDCQSSIPSIKVYNQHGRWWKFAPQDEWVYSWLKERDGIARIQLATADTLSPRLTPPTIPDNDWVEMGQALYVQTAEQEKVVEASGWEYGGAGYGGKVYTYSPLGLSDPTEQGDSGSGEYDLTGDLTGIHFGHMGDERAYGGFIQPGMVP